MPPFHIRSEDSERLRRILNSGIEQALHLSARSNRQGCRKDRRSEAGCESEASARCDFWRDRASGLASRQWQGPAPGCANRSGPHDHADVRHMWCPVIDPSFPFRLVLVANRGEIAVRIVRTLQKLGLQSAVVYHEVDAQSLAVALADHAIEISGRTPVSSYLDGDQIIAAALSVAAGAIHPGYGFLSENAAFARVVEAAGLVFIGPSADVIELMGDKIRARNFVAHNGFPVAPSAVEEDDPATFLDRARAVGVPLVVKPSAGGGGKGMRIVRDLAELDDARGAKGSVISATGDCMPSG